MDLNTHNYDLFAEVYDLDSQTNIWNALYERPEMLRLLGDVQNLDVLDAGCGSGLLTQALIQRGARVTGIDNSNCMLNIARSRLTGQAILQEVDLNQPLPFEDNHYDRIAASLVIHYLANWPALASEFSRVLKPGGQLVISTHNPFNDYKISGRPDYLTTYEFTDEWIKNNVSCRVKHWHRPLQQIIAPLLVAPLYFSGLSEPTPLPEAEAAFPEEYIRIVCDTPFIFLCARKQ